MPYVDPDYKTKKAFKEAVKSGVRHWPYNPSGLFPPKKEGSEVIEGPHYPKPHTWYAQVQMESGFVVKVVS
ncbi:hypothetical protein LCGC14_2010580 [marine sediment metagenome]|uniref:Uncharacterized protein n=1 Tax=marine sediment metagenome TaxID=412755 RepID=A0A0F9HDU8_9ZZZZ